MKKQTATQLCIIMLITLIFAPLATSNTQSITDSENETFSIIWITDTQYLTESNPSYNVILSRWIVENSDTYNVKMVIHTGDLVNEEGNRTQWLNANQSMDILLDNGIPYCWNAGNHDFNSTYWIGNQYTAFNPQILETKPYWVSTKFDGLNTAVYFNVSGWECLIVNIAYDANASALTWANSMLDSYSQAHAIVATHAYIDKQCKYDEWATTLKTTVLDNHANVFLTLSGHYYPTAGNRTRAGERDELLFNQQDAYEKRGAASARILTFNTADGTIKVQTYSLYLKQFIDDANNSFTLNTSFHNNSAVCAFPVVLIGAVLAGVVVAVLCLIFVKQRVKRRTY